MKLSKQKIFSILESALFLSPEPLSISELTTLLQEKTKTQEKTDTQTNRENTNIKDFTNIKHLKNIMEELIEEYNKEERGIHIQKVAQGYQLRTKPENKPWLSQWGKQRGFRLSGPALETLSIVAYKQPCTRHDVDSIRGVESGHLMRTLMEKELISFAGKSDDPGKPVLYKTTNKFLETFGFKSLKDLPSEEEIEKLLPQQSKEEDDTSLADITQDDAITTTSALSFEKDEQENEKLKNTLKNIPSTIDFLENKNSENKEQNDPEI